MITDSSGLQWELLNGIPHIRYPNKKEGWGAPIPVEFPAWYFTKPPNEITRERCEIITSL